MKKLIKAFIEQKKKELIILENDKFQSEWRDGFRRGQIVNIKDTINILKALLETK